MIKTWVKKSVLALNHITLEERFFCAVSGVEPAHFQTVTLLHIKHYLLLKNIDYI